jgi:O-succinylbenzoate synthase
MADDHPAGELTRAWVGIGAAGSLELEAVELWRVQLPFTRPVATAKGVHRVRPLVMVKVIGRTDPGQVDGGATALQRVEGWGECAALADATYDQEDVDGSFRALEETLVPALLARASEAGSSLPPPSTLDSVRASAPQAPLAFAALEMAVADAHLRAEHRSLAEVLGVAGRSVDLGAVVGQTDTVEELVETASVLAAQGYGRLKIKVGPGWDVVPVEAVTRTVPQLRLQVDANGSYEEADRDHLAELDRFGLLCIEQPFDPSDLEAHARLAGRIATPVCLDESLDSPAIVQRALAMGACSVVCVKPARLGGLGAALRVVESCAAAGVPLWMGGMFESGYARGVNTTLAALPGFSWPGDLSPSRSYLDDDLVAAPRPAPTGPGGGVRAQVSAGAGMGPPPDPAGLDRLGAENLRLEAPASS